MSVIKTITDNLPEHGRKDDKDKLPLELLSPYALESIAVVLQHGAKRYGARNWEKGLNFSRIAGAALRHLVALLKGEAIDPDSGLHHAHHLACEAMFLSHYVAKGGYAAFDDLGIGGKGALD